MGLFSGLFKAIGKIIRPVSKIIKPLAIASVVYHVIRKKRKKPRTSNPDYIIKNPTPNPYSRWGNYLITQGYPPYPPLPPVPSSPVTSQMLKLMNSYIANLRAMANQLTQERAEQLRDIMGARGLLRSGWTAKALGRLPSEVWMQLAPQLSSFMSQVQQAIASDWYSNYLKNLSNWQAGLRWW